MKIYSVKTSVITFLFLIITLLIGCNDDGTTNTPETSNIPEIVGCNSVKYQGYTFTNLGCQPGMVSFDISGSQNGHDFSFHVTCSNGCISSVTVK